eukprot:TRINITY_DN22414_c0_g1_i1.p1 TRINITY_DN22414_c0_g1~~TRINITY_DN22414_c0_g1_i1.p1  ORF type:complete len:274 (+),score=98.65 TRINITY_DN22414_c0_g1_i1:32-853(+)
MGKKGEAAAKPAKKGEASKKPEVAKKAEAPKKAAAPAPVVKKAVKKTGPKAPRNKDLVKGVGQYSRSAMYHKKGLWALKKKNGGQFPKHPKKQQKVEEKTRAPKFYPAEDVKKPLHKNVINKPTKLRSSITPGTVLILLGGQSKGKRVVFLKQLQSGLLLVTGPYKINGVPLRRVNQVFVIATSTKVDISGVDLSKFDDAYFKKEDDKTKKGESDFFDSEKEEKKEVSPQRIEDQKAVDGKLVAAIEKVSYLKSYIASRFSLKSGMKPHELVF